MRTKRLGVCGAGRLSVIANPQVEELFALRVNPFCHLRAARLRHTRGTMGKPANFGCMRRGPRAHALSLSSWGAATAFAITHGEPTEFDRCSCTGGTRRYAPSLHWVQKRPRSLHTVSPSPSAQSPALYGVHRTARIQKKPRPTRAEMLTSFHGVGPTSGQSNAEIRAIAAYTRRRNSSTLPRTHCGPESYSAILLFTTSFATSIAFSSKGMSSSGVAPTLPLSLTISSGSENALLPNIIIS